MPPSNAAHWDSVYSQRDEATLTWQQPAPTLSMALARTAGLAAHWAVIDVGGGRSRLVDSLLAEGLRDITVLDLSQAALLANQARLGATPVTWIAADICRWEPERQFDLWHDRAAFHFLTRAEDRRAYRTRMAKALAPGGHAIIASFGLDGPERCSGLPVQRYSPQTLAAELGDAFTLRAHRAERHPTPAGGVQAFQYSLLQRV